MSPLALAAAATSGRSSAAEPTRPPPSSPALREELRPRVAGGRRSGLAQRAVRVEPVDVHVHAHQPPMNPVAATAASICFLVLAASSAPGAGYDDGPSA